MKLNDVLIDLDAAGDQQGPAAEFSAPGLAVAARTLGDEADWRQNAELVFELEQGLWTTAASTRARRDVDPAGESHKSGPATLTRAF